MPRSISRGALWCSLLVPTVMTGGCQRGSTWNLVPVEGTVTKGGRPLPGLKVIFLADPTAGTAGPRTAGITDEAGRYRLRTDHGDDGAVAGKHRVLVVDFKAREEMQRLEVRPQLTETALTSSRVPPVYEDFERTPLRIEVRPDSQVIDFDVQGAAIQVE